MGVMKNKKLWSVILKLFKAGGWFPAAVFFGHLLLKFGVKIYSFWPDADMPLHFLGGLSIAYFVAGAFNVLSHESVKSSRSKLLELVLVVSLTATVAVFWEFGEFASDLVLGTYLQGGLVDTMQDLMLGMVGAFVVFFVRAWQMNMGLKEVKEFVSGMSG